INKDDFARIPLWFEDDDENYAVDDIFAQKFHRPSKLKIALFHMFSLVPGFEMRTSPSTAPSGGSANATSRVTSSRINAIASADETPGGTRDITDDIVGGGGITRPKSETLIDTTGITTTDDNNMITQQAASPQPLQQSQDDENTIIQSGLADSLSAGLEIGGGGGQPLDFRPSQNSASAFRASQTQNSAPASASSHHVSQNQQQQQQQKFGGGVRFLREHEKIPEDGSLLDVMAFLMCCCLDDSTKFGIQKSFWVLAEREDGALSLQQLYNLFHYWLVLVDETNRLGTEQFEDPIPMELLQKVFEEVGLSPDDYITFDQFCSSPEGSTLLNCPLFAIEDLSMSGARSRPQSSFAFPK
ncbi:hypothetical protein HDU76_006992, partial [Blyttiomyces sp. JEL0837]